MCEERGCGKRDGCVRRGGVGRGMGVWEEGWACEEGGWRGCGKRDGRVRRGMEFISAVELMWASI